MSPTSVANWSTPYLTTFHETVGENWTNVQLCSSQIEQQEKHKQNIPGWSTRFLGEFFWGENSLDENFWGESFWVKIFGVIIFWVKFFG